MKYVKRIMPFLLLGLIIGLVLLGENVKDKLRTDMQKRENVYVITSESTKALEAPPTATKWKTKDVSFLDSFQRELLDSLDTGVYQINDSTVVVVPPKHVKYTYVKQSIDKTNELKIIVKGTESKDSRNYLVGEIELSKPIPIGIYNENGEFLH